MPQGKSTKFYGDLGEDFALSLLKRNGYRILDRKFKSKFGEIDIVAQDKDTLVFVEVKARWSKKFGSPEEAVDARKLFKIKKTVEYYSLVHPNLPRKLRIDVVAIEIKEGRVVSSKIIKVD